MKTLLTLFVFLSSLTISPKKIETVYICVSPGAKVYHQAKDCNGLQKCKHEIKSVSIADAVNVYGRRACKICY